MNSELSEGFKKKLSYANLKKRVKLLKDIKK